MLTGVGGSGVWVHDGCGHGKAADTTATRGSHYLHMCFLEQTSHPSVISVSSPVNSTGRLCSSNTLSLPPAGL